MKDRKKRSPGRPLRYRKALCRQVIALGAQGLSQGEISMRLGIPRSTLLSWARRFEEFSLALGRAKEAELAWWEKQGRDALCGKRNFNAAVWIKSMQARFPEKYTSRRRCEITGLKMEAGKAASRAGSLIEESREDERR